MLTLGKFNNIKHTERYKIWNQELEHVFEETDLGIIIDSELTLVEHISSKVKKANTIVVDDLLHTWTASLLRRFIPLLLPPSGVRTIRMVTTFTKICQYAGKCPNSCNKVGRWSREFGL